jgi:uncharacterized membrane protein
MAEKRPRLDQPAAPRRGPRLRIDAEAFGQWTEKFARFLGTGRFLVIQTLLIVVWVVGNAIPGFPHPDEYPFLFLTLALSLQASYAAPLILLAQNRQDDRDRVNLEADREEAREAKADLDYLAREIAAVRMALGEVATRDFLRAELSRAEAAREQRESEAERAADSA